MKNHLVRGLTAFLFCLFTQAHVATSEVADIDGHVIQGSLDWPRYWTVFGPLDHDDPLPSAEQLRRIPEQLRIGSDLLEPQRTRPNRSQAIALEDLYPEAGRLTTAYAYLPLESPQAQAVTLGMGGNWWMQAWLNGELILDTTESSNMFTPIGITNHLVDVELKAGLNVLVARLICGSGGTDLAIGGPDQLRQPELEPDRIDVTATLYQAAVIDPALSMSTGSGITLALERNFARPAERWIEYFLKIDPELNADDIHVEESLYGLHDGALLLQDSYIPDGPLMRRAVDLRSHNVNAARLRAELYQGNKRLGAAEAMLESRQAPAAPTAGQIVPVHIDLPNGVDQVSDWPVTFGIPFPTGSLWDVERFKIADASGNPVPFQAEVVARWAPDGAIKWVRIDALADSTKGLALVAAEPGEKSLPAHPLTVVQDDEGIIRVDTGAAQYRISAAGALLQSVSRDGRKTAADGGRGLYLIDQHGRIATASEQGAEVSIEADGPVAASIRIAGIYRLEDGEQIARHITRLEFFAGRPEAEITHTLVLTRDSNEIWFREVGWEFNVDPGAQPQALMAVSRQDPDQYRQLALDSGSVQMLQSEYPGLGGGERKHFSLSRTLADGAVETLYEGEEMGDWAAVSGASSAFMLCLPAAALQHPKEIQVSAEHVVLKLFSNAAGHELDFRGPALAERWGLSGREANRVSGFNSNAIGWSRTHRLLVAPLAPVDAAAEASSLARIYVPEIHVLIDPDWIYRSRALGALHPRDTERFPDAENVIQKSIENYMERVPAEHYTGFVDYYGGPHYGFRGRYRLTYTLLPDSWLLYARSGDRRIREFAQGANRAFMDNYVAHWDGPGKTRGLFLGSTSPMADYPLYWEQQTTDTLSTTSDFNRSLADYYLTGYRRGGDIVQLYADNVARSWHPESRAARVILKTRLLAQAYSHTWDPYLRALIEGTLTEGAYDPDGSLLLTKNRPYRSTTYKTPTDQDVFVELYEVLGNRRSKDMGTKLAEYWWNRNGIAGRSTGIAAHFLYEQTGDPAIAAGMDHFLRREAMRYDPDTDLLVPSAYSQLARLFQGIPHAMDIVVRTDADRTVPAAWLHFDDFREPARFFFLKDNEHKSELLYRDPDDRGFARGGSTGDAVSLIPHARARPAWAGQDVHEIHYISGGQILITVPKDAPGGVYEIAPAKRGEQFMLADPGTPLVFMATSYWQPFSLRPEVPVYFALTDDTRDAALFLEGSGYLFDPQDRPFADGQAVSGWVDLPDGAAGIWTLLPQQNGLIRARNFPPFFTMGDKRFHFIPEGIEWKREDVPGDGGLIAAGDPDQMFVRGALKTPQDQALYLPARRQFRIENEAELLPHSEGTIEYFFRPDWGTFDLRDGLESVSHQLMRVEADSPWTLDYRIDPTGTRINRGPREPAHSLFGRFSVFTDGDRSAQFRLWRTRTLFEADRWVHVAWQWQQVPSTNGPLTEMQIFVDGQPASNEYASFPLSAAGSLPAEPQALTLSGGPGAAIDQLRISSVPRYDGPFTPPGRDQPLELDADTRVLFRFDGTLDGDTPSGTGSVSGMVR